MKRYALVLLVGCSSGSGGAPPGFDATTPGDTCGAIRLTHYTAAAEGWCQWDRTRSFLPAFVRNGMTAAIGEPWNGGSYAGPAGASCGECWEITSLTGSTLVMVHDLCPIQGNPVCAGSFFHFDLADEAGAVLVADGLGAASARRVACPVTGNVYAQVNDQNPGYLRLSFVNHRIPIRDAFLRGAGPGVAADNPWVAMPREGGAFAIVGASGPLARGGTGIQLRVVSAQGETLDLPNPIPLAATGGTAVDLGAQLTDQAPAGGATCTFAAPADVYVDGYGGIDRVRWRFNGWTPSLAAREVTSGCSSGSCLRIDGIAQWSGFHLYYVEPFPTGSFQQLTLSAHVTSGTGSISVAPSLAGVTCTGTVVTLTADPTPVTIDLASVCPATSQLDAITVQAQSPLGLVLDDVRFVP